MSCICVKRGGKRSGRRNAPFAGLIALKILYLEWTPILGKSWEDVTTFVVVLDHPVPFEHFVSARANRNRLQLWLSNHQQLVLFYFSRAPILGAAPRVDAYNLVACWQLLHLAKVAFSVPLLPPGFCLLRLMSSLLNACHCAVSLAKVSSKQRMWLASVPCFCSFVF